MAENRLRQPPYKRFTIKRKPTL